ncbi:hypothetical protein C8Q79DRAFT_360882 [Trametes meyenii]|nr:hypothetical protein C8Q79DRAFT_360882 [Trametes meyenii]
MERKGHSPANLAPRPAEFGPTSISAAPAEASNCCRLMSSRARLSFTSLAGPCASPHSYTPRPTRGPLVPHVRACLTREPCSIAAYVTCAPGSGATPKGGARESDVRRRRRTRAHARPRGGAVDVNASGPVCSAAAGASPGSRCAASTRVKLGTDANQIEGDEDHPACWAASCCTGSRTLDAGRMCQSGLPMAGTRQVRVVARSDTA